MSKQSLDQISPKDLAKINAYLDDATDSLTKNHSIDETKQIILILREQIFRQIELQDALHQPFDIDAILEKNFKDNRDLITGNDRNQVLFTIKRPSWLSSSSQQEKTVEKGRSEDTGSSEDGWRQYFNHYPNLTSNLVLALLYLFLILLPADPIVLYAQIVLVISLVFFSPRGEHNIENWLLSTSILTLGMIFSSISLGSYNNNDIIAFFAILVFPMFVLVNIYDLYRFNVIDLNYKQAGKITRFLTTILLSLFIGAILFAIMSVYFSIVGNIVVHASVHNSYYRYFYVDYELLSVINSLLTGVFLLIFHFLLKEKYYEVNLRLLGTASDSMKAKSPQENTQVKSQVISPNISHQVVDNSSSAVMSQPTVQDRTSFEPSVKQEAVREFLPVRRQEPEFITQENVENSTFVIITAIAYIIVAIYPDSQFILLSQFILIFYLVMALPVFRWGREWLLSYYLMVFGIILGTVNMIFFQDGFFALLFVPLILPLFTLITSIKLLHEEFVDKKFKNYGNLHKGLVVLLYTALTYFGIFLAVIGYYLLAQDVTWSNSPYDAYNNEFMLRLTTLHLVVLGIGLVFYLVFIRKRFNNTIYRTSGGNSRFPRDQITDSNQYYQSETVDLTSLLGESTETSRVQLEVDMSSIKRITKIRILTPIRIFLLISSIPIFVISFFFSRLDDRYALVYYIKALNLQGLYDINYPWAFQWDITYGLIYLGLIFIASVVVLVTVEVLQSESKKELQRVINHLVLRQGIISVSTLSKVPPNLEPIEYYNSLGKLVVEGVVRLRHVEVSK